MSMNKHINNVIAVLAAMVVQDDPEANIGLTWESKSGTREVIGFQNGRYLIKEPGSSPHRTLIQEKDLAREIQFDTRNMESSARNAPKSEAGPNTQSLDAYVASLPPMRGGKVREALLIQRGFSGKFMKRHVFAEKAAASGATVDHNSEGRVLSMPDGGYYREKDVSKVVLDYVEWLLAQG